jgi:serine/threonine protein kinase/tetratricopeptide (TPR) repeat protein
MAAQINDNETVTLKEALQRFVEVYFRGQQPDIDDFVQQFPQHEAQLRKRIQDLREIDTLFNSIFQVEGSEFEDLTDELDLIGKKIGSFEIVKTIGRGGMGVVYLARDTKLKRSVAIKSIPDALVGSSTARMRFRREAELLASLNHPNIAVIYEIIEEEKSTYLVLEYIEGQTLAERISQKPLELAETLSISRQVCEAVSAAHKKGIIHRDLKPGNIKITPDGNVKVLDFGLAKIPAANAGNTETTATQRHHIKGTPAYMSPEQARGNEIDHHTDIWAFGCIMYQMLTGKLPFDGKTATDTIVGIIECEPDWELLPEETPGHIRILLRRCLEKKPENRLDDIADAKIQINDTLSKPLAAPVPAVSPKLKKVAMIVSAIVIVALCAVGVRFIPGKRAQSPSGNIVLAVLPFEYFGPSGEEWLASGITDAITTRLGRIHGLGVMSRESGIQFKNMGIPLAKESYSFDYYLAGSVLCERPSDPNGRVNIGIKLINTADSTQTWQETYDYYKRDIIQSQTDITEMVARVLDMKLIESEREAIPYGYTDNTEAYDYFLRGQHYRSLGTEEGRTKAIEMFNNAIAMEESYAEAYVSLSHILMNLYWLRRNLESLPGAREAAFKALQFAPELPEAHIAVGRYYYQGCYDYEKALDEFAIACNSYPNHISAIRWTAYCQKRMGKFEDALNNLLIAAKLDPVNSLTRREIAHTLGFLRRYEEAMDYYEQVITMKPNDAFPYWQQAWLYLGWKGDIINARRAVDRALQTNIITAEYGRIFHVLVTIDIYSNEYEKALDRILSRSKDYSNMTWFIPNDLWLAEVYGYMGKEESARKCYEVAVATLEKKLDEDPDNYSVHSSLGKAYAGLGREDEAIMEGKEGVKTKDAINRPLRLEDLARIYVMLDRHSDAIDILKDLLFNIPSELMIYKLKLDPVWDPLRDYPRFKKLIETGK